jgi:hypothetical protein
MVCDTAYIYVTVTADGNCNPNNPPVAVNDAASVEGGSSVTIPVLTNDSDPDGDAFSITSNTQPAHGTVTLVGNQFVYTPNPGYEGTDVFTYQICDIHGACDVATVTITVTQPCQETTYICTQPLTPLVICPNFCNIPNGIVTIVEANTTYNCSLHDLGGGCIQYTALPLFAGEETITITGCNQFGVCETIQITINVTDDCDGVGMAPEGNNGGIQDNGAQKTISDAENALNLLNLAITDIMPVPATDYVEIQFNADAGAVTMTIADITGKIMTSQNIQVQKGLNTQKVELHDYATGIYMVTLQLGDAKVNGKFVKH